MVENPNNRQWVETGGLLAKWYERARINQLQHYEAAQYYEKAHQAVGLPVVVLSTVVGTTVFATMQKLVDVRMQIAVGALSVLAAVLAALQTFLRYGERAEKHRTTAATYAAIRHRLEATTHMPVELRPPLKEFLGGIEGQIDSLAQSAPSVPQRVWKRIEKMKSGAHFEIAAFRYEDTGGSTNAPAAAPPSDSADDPYRF